jgi:hypothetical protein
MDEASQVYHTQLSEHSRTKYVRAIIAIAMYEARKEIKRNIQREGRIKLCKVPARDITAMAKARLFEDAEYRAKLIADAKRVVEQLRMEGYFGKAVQHSQDLHKPGSAEPQPLPLCENS